MSSTRSLIMIVFALMLACRKQPSKPPSTGSAASDVGTCVQIASPCTGLECGTGGNSAYTNVFPVNGLGSGGACNPDNIQLMPGSLNGGLCQAVGADLVFDAAKHRIVGMKAGVEVCKKDKLAGATFQVRARNLVTFTIKDVEEFDEEHVHYEGYRIEYGSGSDNSLCDYTTARQALIDLGFGSGSDNDCPPIGSHVGSAEPYADLVVALPGPIYNQITGSAMSGTDALFNLACAGDALAKTAFYQINDTTAVTTAALRMITARYGGSNQPFTIRGIPISVEQDLSANQRSQLVPEAKWDNTGKAMCVSTPRLMTIPDAPASIPACLHPTGSGSDWTSQLQSQLGIGSCDSSFGSGSGELFRSWTGGDGTAVLSYRHK